jgi:anaerobic magnesium-protoporphyrin IX monomethyl ester cyclase
MRIIFISPRAIDTPTQPLGILYLAAVLLKAGHEVKVIDPNIDDSVSTIADSVLLFKPDLIGISATTAQIENGIDIAACIKEKNHFIPIIIGGAHATVCSKDVLMKPPVDYVAIGEGEHIIINLVNALQLKTPIDQVRGIGYKKNGEAIFTHREPLIENLDEIPFPARELLNSRYYYAPPRIRGIWTKATATVMASRGCPFKCIWCSSHTVFGYKVRYRSPENVLAELQHLIDEFNIDSIYFIDDTFTLNPKYVEKVCNLIIEKKWKDLKWGCQARVDTVSEDMLKLMKKAGCIQLDFGVESGSPKILANLKKQIDIDAIKKAFMICHKVGMNAFASFMIGTPGENIDDIIMTKQLIREIKPDYCEFFYATPYPGTEFYDLVVERGALPKNASFIDWYASKQVDRPKIHLDSSEDDIIKYRTMLHNSVVLNNYLTLLKNPSFLIGGLGILIKGFPGIFNGIGRFLKTGKFDNILVEILAYYRKKLKSRD